MRGLLLIEMNKFQDERGTFQELYNAKKYEDLLPKHTHFVQDNFSRSKKNVFRGLHFQSPPMAQGKLVQVLEGKALDLVVDIRKDSNTFGESFTVELSETNNLQLYVPRGFAHGFYSLSENTLFHYKCDNYYSREHEQTLKWDDKKWELDIDNRALIISEKDLKGVAFADFVSPF
ncbi:MAG: dTDP-4-dehydrorhamnose 3,5-epimerase [Flavobacteriales bacterium]|nr:dTDP-4-dehydrorhamnose 3,5-epimerase [Flavobacteriales bacterium]